MLAIRRDLSQDHSGLDVKWLQMLANDVFRDPVIQARITTESSVISAKWERLKKRLRGRRPTQAEIIKTFAALFDVYARSYLGAVNHSTIAPEYETLLRDISNALISDLDKWEIFRGYFNEGDIRGLAEESEDLPIRLATLSAEQREREIQFHVDRIKGLHANETKEWSEWRSQVFLGLARASEEKIQFWANAAVEHIAGLPKNSPPVDGHQPIDFGLTIRDQRKAAINFYIEEVFRVTGKKLRRIDIWTEAGYATRTEFERWERADPRTTKAADKEFHSDIASKTPSEVTFHARPRFSTHCPRVRVGVHSRMG